MARSSHFADRRRQRVATMARAARRHENLDLTDARNRLATLAVALREVAEGKGSDEGWVSLLGTQDRPLIYLETASVYDAGDPGIEVTLQEARTRWSQILDVVLHHDREVWLTRRGERVLVLYRNHEVASPVQDLLDRDTTGDEEDGPTLGDRIDALGLRLDEGLRNVAESIEKSVGPVRRMLVEDWRVRDGRHPRIAVQ